MTTLSYFIFLIILLFRQLTIKRIYMILFIYISETNKFIASVKGKIILKQSSYLQIESNLKIIFCLLFFQFLYILNCSKKFNLYNYF